MAGSPRAAVRASVWPWRPVYWGWLRSERHHVGHGPRHHLHLVGDDEEVVVGMAVPILLAKGREIVAANKPGSVNVYRVPGNERGLKLEDGPFRISRTGNSSRNSLGGQENDTVGKAVSPFLYNHPPILTVTLSVDVPVLLGVLVVRVVVGNKRPAAVLSGISRHDMIPVPVADLRNTISLFE